MAKKAQDTSARITLQVSTRERPDFKQPLAAYVFDASGKLTERAEVRDGKVELTLQRGQVGRARVFIAPVDERLEKPTLATLERLRAYEPVLQLGDQLRDRIEIPGIIIDIWPFCFCWVRGRVVRSSDNRAVCNARVHICEVDRVPLLIAKLPDLEIVRLRDDLLEILRNPPIPRPGPIPDPPPFLGRLKAAPTSSLFRFSTQTASAGYTNPATLVGFNPQPEPPGSRVGFNPQPDPPLTRVALNPQPLPPGSRLRVNPVPEPPSSRAGFDPQPDPPRELLLLSSELQARLRSASTLVVRTALIDNWKLLIPWFCVWPWWWWYFRCDEVAVVTTDGYGRFETTIFYPCGGDQPDLYFWVEYDFGSGFETVYKPWIACNTYWNFACGSEITIRVSDPRVPGCEQEPDLPGCQVVVLSIGRNIAVRQVQTAGAEGVTTAGQPFGATLEPRVDFSRTCLIDEKDIPYYRWSYRRLTGPDGTSGTVDPGSVPLNVWKIMTRDVYRHYKVGTTYPSDLMGPMPTAGPDAAPAPNLFRIRPVDPPAGDEWIVLNETIDLATAYFDTGTLAGVPTAGPPFPDDLAAGLYEVKLELFKEATGALVNWTAEGIDLRITDQDAPFGTGTITTSPAPAYNRILSGGDTMGFRMVLRVDNNRCAAEILPVGGTVTPDPICGFHNYNLPSDVAALSFVARHANNFATYSFVVTRGPGPSIPAASTSGVAGAAGNDGFSEIADFTYSKDVIISTLLGPCSNAAYSERLDVMARATNGYGTLTGYNAADNAAFALAVPCPECECEEDEDGDGRGRGRGPR